MKVRSLLAAAVAAVTIPLGGAAGVLAVSGTAEAATSCGTEATITFEYDSLCEPAGLYIYAVTETGYPVYQVVAGSAAVTVTDVDLQGPSVSYLAPGQAVNLPTSSQTLVIVTVG
jgi:hypothetical protein